MTSLIEELTELHHCAPVLRCGARAVRPVEHYHGDTTAANLVCTEKPGHDGLHKDAICCWRFHAFSDAEPAPEDVYKGRLCSCGNLNCQTRAILEKWTND